MEASNFNNLPEVFNTVLLAKFIGVSRSKVYDMVVKDNLPHLKLERKIIIFKQQFIDWYMHKKITPFNKLKVIDNLPESFSIDILHDTLSISKSKAYNLVRLKNFPHWNVGTRIIIFKSEFVAWISSFSHAT